MAGTTQSKSESVLIVRLGAIGDVLMLLPAVHALHVRGARIDWVCGKVVAPWLAMYPWINRIQVDEQQLFHAGKLGQAKALLGLWRQLAGRRYDLCAVMQYDRRYRLLTNMVSARRRFHLDKSRRSAGLIEGRWHANEYARVLGLAPDDYHDWNVRLVRPEPANIPALDPATWGVQLNPGRRVALVPAGAKNVLREGALRRWPIENYVALAQELLASGYEVVLTGSADDAWARPHFGEVLQLTGVWDCIGQTSLPQLLALYDTCEAVITHDTGSMHVAGISNAKVLAIFGPTAMGNFLPRRAGVKGIGGGEQLACRPCYDGRDFAACASNVCMQQTAVARVMAELHSLLA